MNDKADKYNGRNVHLYNRWSDKKQSQGSSQARQKTGAEEAVERHGWKVVSTLEDQGVSGFKGHNLDEGAKLRSFLEMIKKGEVGKGDVLVVEAMDRLTREEIDQAFTLVCDILRAGIVLHTTMNDKFYDNDSLNSLPDMMMVLVELHLANEHSRKLQKRLKEYWRIRRNEVAEGKVKYTKKTPYWIDSTTKTWTPIQKQVDKITLIFAKYNGGWGMTKITKYLNQNGILPLRNGMDGKKAQWSNSMVSRVLRDEHVVGRFRLCKVEEVSTKSGRKRSNQVQIGDVIENYFPAIVSEMEFAKANALLNSRTTKKIRDNQQTRNIAAGLLYCSCGSKIQRIPSGSGNAYLICNAKKDGFGCKSPSIRYENWEQVILAMLLTKKETFTRKQTKMSDKIDLLDETLRRNKQEQDNLLNLAKSLAAPNKLLIEKIDRLEEAENNIQEQIKAEKTSANSNENFPEDLSDLTVEKIKESEDLRRTAKAHLHKVIRKIVFTEGEFEIEFEESCDESDLFKIAEPLLEVVDQDRAAA